MVKSYTGRKRVRKNFGRVISVEQMPNLIDVQKNSYKEFLEKGLNEALKSVFPIKGYNNRGVLEYDSYVLEEPKYDEEECIKRGLTYSRQLTAKLRLVVFDEMGGIQDVKEQDVYMGDLPVMTETGTFIVNGTERVVVSQMHRSPGVFFDHDDGKVHSSGKKLYSARIIPYRGSWVDFEFDSKDMLNVRIDRRRKLPISCLLYCLDSEKTAKQRVDFAAKGRQINPLEVIGMDKEEILNYFYKSIPVKLGKDGICTVEFNGEAFKGKKIKFDLIDAESGEVVAEKGTMLNALKLKKLTLKNRQLTTEELTGKFVADDMIDEKTGRIICEAGDEINEALLTKFEKNKVKQFNVLDIDGENVGPYIRNTICADRVKTREQALAEIYKIMRPGEPPTVEAGDRIFYNTVFNPELYDLSAVGRVKLNARLGFSNKDVPDTVRVLRKEDILGIIKLLVAIKDGQGEVDDIDNLGNRRVRSVGELMENQYRAGLVKMVRGIIDKMNGTDVETCMPHDLVNAKPASSSVRDFFTSSQLSQFMDQNNPLAEITHKRRLSALGPGGLTRDRAGFEVRDVHPTHYSRICPIETPEGPNIGLINSLTSYARVNIYGFIEAPYRVVKDKKVTKEVIYLSAMDEGLFENGKPKYVIAQADARLDSKDCLKDDFVVCRCNGEFENRLAEDVNLMDVSPQQLVSCGAALIPFLENDAANRALMGANMQRQAVPLIRSDAPLVGTGMEGAVARDSGAAIVAKRKGEVLSVDATRIVIRATGRLKAEESGVDIYDLRKYQRSNQSTCINQVPIVRVGDVVSAGDIIADGPCTHVGELALGRNVLVAYMPWNGYNYEDAILISERIARDDVFTSIHIDEFEVVARDTKLGQEEITRDIPNVGEEALKQLDESGIIYIGAEVKAGDILIGKVSPKGESPMTPEEKLLRAIFGEKASDVKDTSLRVPPGIEGTVVEVRVFSRRGIDKDERAKAIENAEILKLDNDRQTELKILKASYASRLRELLVGQKAQKALEGSKGVVVGKEITADVLEALNVDELFRIAVENDEVMRDVEKMKKIFDERVKKLNDKFSDKVEKLQAGDELPPGVLKSVKVFIAVKRKLQPGDKMAGRHGNKGVVSRVLPIEDMPHTKDGTPVDLVLNPLGVPSRMNVGQILECHLGWACQALGQQVYTTYEEVEAGKKSVKDLRAKLDEVYDGKKEAKDIAKMSDDEVMDLAANMKTGMLVATPVFDGAKEDDINGMLEKAHLPVSGQIDLYDGRTGEKFDRPVTIGIAYMLKLHHLVDEKMHARSVGPYSLVTQQPLGGKAQFGGQRLGEMEAWALEAYGAAHTLQEMLTVKSDDVDGRTAFYNSIVQGENKFEPGVPASFNVLVKEMQALCLDVEYTDNDNNKS